MPRKLMVLVVAAVVIGLVVGCARRSVTIKGPEGQKATVTTSKKGGKVVINEKEGKATIESSGEKATMTFEGEEGTTRVEISENVDLAKLGVDVYPGAKIEGGGTYSATGAESGEISGVNMTTPDPFDKVAKFYKDKYGKGAKLVQQMGNMLMIQMEKNGKIISIVVQREEDEDKTSIGVSAVSGEDM